MRKFTKEIAALLAAVSVSASANMASAPAENANAASNNSTSMSVLDSTIGTVVSTAATTTKVTSRLAPAPGSTLPPDEGVQMIPDEYTTTTTTPTIGTQTSKSTTITRATTTTKMGTQISKLTTTTTTTTTTTVGTEVSKLTTTTAVPSNDRIELPFEEIDIDEALWNNDEIEDHSASFYAQCAEYVVLQYSVEGDCDEIEGVFVTAIDHEMVEEFFTAAVKNGIATVSYRVPFNSDDFITAAVFDSKEKGVNLEKVELVNLESGRTTTTFPPLMGTIVATTETTTIPPLEGDMMPSDEETTTTTTVPPLAGVTTSTRPRQTDIPPLMGTQTIPTSTTTQTYIAGGMMPSDEKTTTTTTTTTPTIGTQMPTTEPTTIPPLMGVMPYIIEGDANNDSTVSIADAAAILQYIANPDKYGLSEDGMMQADVVGNGNGITVDDAIAIQKLDAKIIDDFSELE